MTIELIDICAYIAVCNFKSIVLYVIVFHILYIMYSIIVSVLYVFLVVFVIIIVSVMCARPSAQQCFREDGLTLGW